MLSSQFLLPIHNEIVVDLFAGGGGASTGIEQAIGRAVDVAINHDPEAISLHTANHPQTQHFCSDVFEVDPVAATGGRPVGLLWASPDCKHFSKAKGGKPVSKKIRSLAWVVVKWAKAVRPRMIFLENVEEFQTWGPLTADNLPCPLRKGDTFRLWKKSLEKLGYVVEHRELRACDYGTPTIRKRLFLVARRDGQPIVWPEPTHAAPGSLAIKAKKLKPWRTAAECIDWSIAAPSIFERKKPLAEATCRRIAKGIMRYVVEADEPFIVSLTHQGGERVESLSEPFKTVTGANRGEKALCVPTLIQTGYGEREGQAPRALDMAKPLGTLVGTQKHALVIAFLAKHYTGVVGSDLADPLGTITCSDHHSLVTANLIHYHADKRTADVRASDLREPIKTQTTENRHALVTSNLVKLRGDNVGSATAEPLHTISAQGTHHAEVRAFLVAYYGVDQDPAMREPMHTVTTKDRFGLVTIHGTEYAIVDIGLRMLTPRELYTAQGFPASYQIDHGADGVPLTKTAQVRMCGNSVCPPLSRAITLANYSEQNVERKVA
jgi:DNA (cytosine-5)-methyltransferase 1